MAVRERRGGPGLNVWLALCEISAEIGGGLAGARASHTKRGTWIVARQSPRVLMLVDWQKSQRAKGKTNVYLREI